MDVSSQERFQSCFHRARPPDPFARLRAVPRPRSASEAHRICPQSVVESVICKAIDCRWFGLARAVAIARCTGARRGDLVKLKHTARQAEGVRIAL